MNNNLLNINLFSEQIDFKYPQDEEKLKRWIILTAANENHQVGDINIIFTTDEYLYDLNRIYLNHNYYTDVITFPYNSPGIISGDIFISVERVKENSEIYKTTFEDELNRVIIHGVLHLLGYKDKTPEEQNIMRQKEDFYLEKLKKL